MGANQILEQKIRVEKSEKMSMVSEFMHVDRFDDNKSIKSGRSRFSAFSGITSKYTQKKLTSFVNQNNLKSR